MDKIMQFLNFTFQDAEHFIGVFILIALLGSIIVSFARSLTGKRDCDCDCDE